MLSSRTMRRAARPLLESLDDRTLPSASVAAVAAHMAVVEARIEARHAALEARIEAREAKLAARDSVLSAKVTRLTPASAAVIVPVAPIPADPTLSGGGTTSTAASSPVVAGVATNSATPDSITAVTSAPAGTAIPALPTSSPVITNTNTGTEISTATADSMGAPIEKSVASSTTPAFTATSTDVSDAQNGPLAKGGTALVALYQDYESYISGGGSSTSFNTSVGNIEVSGGMVGVDLSASGDLATYESDVQALGMTIQHVDGPTGLVEGLLPIDELIAVVQLGNTAGISPVTMPISK